MRFLVALLALAAVGVANASTCYISEFRERPPVTYQAAVVPTLVDQAVNYTTASVQSSIFDYQTQLVRIQCDAPAWVSFGTSPAATLNSLKLIAGQTEYFTIVLHSSIRAAVIGQ